MKLSLTLPAVAIFALLGASVVMAVGQDELAAPKEPKSFTNLWTGNSHIKIARFYTLEMYSFEQDQGADTRAAFRNLFNMFDRDTIALQQEQGLGIVIPIAIKAKVAPAKPYIDSKDALKESLNRLKAKLKNDGTDNVVFVYMLAHGEKNSAGKVEMKVGKELIDRKVDLVEPLRKLVDTKLARLAVVITDNCTALPPSNGPGRSLGFDGAWRALYFGHEGFVDIQTANPDYEQFAFLQGSSLFVEALTDGLTPSISFPDLAGLLPADQRDKFVEKLDSNGDRVLSWEEFKSHLQGQLTKKFDEALRQTNDPTMRDQEQRMKRMGDHKSQEIKFDLSDVRVLNAR